MRQRAVDLLYAMCDKSNAERIVAEMLTYLESADYSIREEMVRLLVLVSVWDFLLHIQPLICRQTTCSFLCVVY